MRTLFCIALALASAMVQAETPARFSFGIVGDAPYGAGDEHAFAQMLEEINQENLAFVVHVGDIKSGSAPCTDALYEQRKRLFQASRYPFILVPGDNEWTDCHRKSAGGYDPIERLAKLRQVFYPDDMSLGQNTLRLARQSDDPASPADFGEYRENVRWVVDRVMFIGLNVQGSNDNFGRTREMDAEHEQRSRANAEWLRRGFDLARSSDYLAVFIVIQANPYFERPHPSPPNRFDVYAAFKQQLLSHTLAFGKPVFLVHGETHRFRVDQPLVDPSTGKRVEQFTRIESFGWPHVDWIKVTIDPADPKLFSYRAGSKQPDAGPKY